MVKIPNKINSIIEKYLKLLKENGFSLNDAYLFGSYAKGNNTKWSDIDIAIVSDDFKGIRILD